jgi:hypothetical protein
LIAGPGCPNDQRSQAPARGNDVIEQEQMQIFSDKVIQFTSKRDFS